MKEKPDGTTKARLIIDLLRSSINGGVLLPERVVLPRLSDLVDAMVDLMECDGPGDGSFSDFYEFATVDFEDAFHTLKLKEEDRGAMAFRTLNGWAVFRRLCCGMAGAPLVWCRVSAGACRLGQACFQPSELRIQCFVDDPAIAVRGQPSKRAWLLGLLFLFWAALGFKFSWKKGARGQEIVWIGARVAVQQRSHPSMACLFPGVAVTLAPEKFQELRKAVEELYKAKGLVPIKQVLRLAGQLSWVSGIFKWIRGFNASLWAAIVAHVAEHTNKAKCSIKKRPMHLFFVLRVRQALSWIRLLLAGLIRTRDGNKMPVERWTPIWTRFRESVFCVRTDASPFGYGAILLHKGQPIAWLAEAWTQLDCQLFKAELGDPAWQAEWELLAVLIAVDTWLPRLHGQVACLVQTDALAALYDIAKGAGRTPAMNALAAEIALRFESAQVHSASEHISGTLNFECDALSRLAQGAAVPSALVSVPQASARLRAASFFWAWTRELLEAQ